MQWLQYGSHLWWTSKLRSVNIRPLCVLFHSIRQITEANRLTIWIIAASHSITFKMQKSFFFHSLHIVRLCHYVGIPCIEGILFRMSVEKLREREKERERKRIKPFLAGIFQPHLFLKIDSNNKKFLFRPPRIYFNDADVAPNKKPSENVSRPSKFWHEQMAKMMIQIKSRKFPVASHFSVLIPSISNINVINWLAIKL